MTYAEKLKDPRWQKKRLEILQRDEFACQLCFDTTNTLHVHHKIYHKSRNPWDYPAEALITLCEDCHHDETLIIEGSIKTLCDIVRTKFLSWQIDRISRGIENFEMLSTPDACASAIEYFLSNHADLMIWSYFNYLADQRKEGGV